jgi:hypothetical protein
VDFVVTPSEAGKLEIYGVAFECGAKFETSFVHKPLSFVVHNVLPQLSLRFLHAVDRELCVGQIARIDLSLRNVSKFQLEKMALLIESSIDAVLVSPAAEELCGQSQLVPLRPDEEVSLVVAVCARRVGQFRLHLLFPYWADVLPRYEYSQTDFAVFPGPKLWIERSFSGLQVIAPPDTWAIGFTGPIPNLDDSLVILDGRFALFDFVSYGRQDERTVIEDYCRPFVDTTKFSFWYQKKGGCICCPIEQPRMPVSICVRSVGRIFRVEVTNLGRKSLAMVRVVMSNGNGNVQCLLSGLTKKVFGKLRPGVPDGFEFAMVTLEAQVVLLIDVRFANFSGHFQIVFNVDDK